MDKQQAKTFVREGNNPEATPIAPSVSPAEELRILLQQVPSSGSFESAALTSRILELSRELSSILSTPKTGTENEEGTAVVTR
jgi:hypothetical protein